MEARLTLDEIFNKNGTDKGSAVGGHSYGKYYEKHLPKKVKSFLEVGVWKGAGIKSFKEWYNNEGYFCGLERYIQGHGLATPGEMNELGIGYFDVDHDDQNQLESVKDKFQVIVEDGSHHFDSQINIFRIMFVNNLESGGVYVVEDVFDDVYWGRGIITDPKQNIKGLLTKFKKEDNIVGQLIGQEESDRICAAIKKVHFYENIIFIEKC